MEIIYLLIGLASGELIAALWVSFKAGKNKMMLEKQLREKEEIVIHEKIEAEKKGMVWEDRFNY